MNHECSICFEHIHKNDIFHTNVCLHVYHNRCIYLWYINCHKKLFSCPLCRTIIQHPSKKKSNKLNKYLTFYEKITIIINDFKEGFDIPIVILLYIVALIVIMFIVLYDFVYNG